MSSDNNQTALVRRAKKGDADAFGALYTTLATDLYRFALYQTGDPTRAEDAVSDAVLSAFEHIAQLHKAQSFRAWMFSILRNCCREQQKEKAAALQRLPLETQEAVLTVAPPAAEGMDLCAALQALNDVDREIVLLSYVGGYTSAEIGELLQFKAGAVRVRLSRARTTLQDMLSTEVPS
ncbi:MAG: RNA polymerase sigma factor [Clostridia bacterium]|nr:RNA polymerase sigma factor [Clostridia bacterium]